MPEDLVLRVPKTDRLLIDALNADASLSATSMSGAGMDGGGEYLLLLIPLTHIAVKAMVELLKAHWERARHVKIEADGLSISGVSLAELEKRLTDLLEKHDPGRR